MSGTLKLDGFSSFFSVVAVIWGVAHVQTHSGVVNADFATRFGVQRLSVQGTQNGLWAVGTLKPGKLLSFDT